MEDVLHAIGGVLLILFVGLRIALTILNYREKRKLNGRDSDSNEFDA